MREADRQGCLTLAEARKIVHGTGTEFDVEGPTRGWDWAGRGNVRALSVTFVHGCADFAIARLPSRSHPVVGQLDRGARLPRVPLMLTRTGPYST